MEVQILDFWNIFKNMEVQILDFWNIFKNMRSKSLNSTQIQDWDQIMVFEIVYLLVQQVFEKTIIIRGTQIPNYHVLLYKHVRMGKHVSPLIV